MVLKTFSSAACSPFSGSFATDSQPFLQATMETNSGVSDGVMLGELKVIARGTLIIVIVVIESSVRLKAFSTKPTPVFKKK
ncbi:MAG: hypothetical protein Q8P67_23955 [archaeon]|nr:hypothetical protein [archaeon]